MQTPFIGTRVVDDIDVTHVFSLIDRSVLFGARWQLKGDLSGEGWRLRVREIAEPTFERLANLCRAKDLIRPRMVYGYFDCERKGNLLLVHYKNYDFSFDFPRERRSPHRCVADFFPDNIITMMLVTVGGEVAHEGARLFKDNRYADAFYLKGLAAEAAEALAAYAQSYIANELDLSDDAGVRFSFGYPACPNLMDQKKLYQLLDAKRIGVTLSRTMHLIPEHSTSAIISFDEKAIRLTP